MSDGTINVLCKYGKLSSGTTSPFNSMQRTISYANHTQISSNLHNDALGKPDTLDKKWLWYCGLLFYTVEWCVILMIAICNYRLVFATTYWYLLLCNGTCYCRLSLAMTDWHLIGLIGNCYSMNWQLLLRMQQLDTVDLYLLLWAGNCYCRLVIGI